MRLNEKAKWSRLIRLPFRKQNMKRVSSKIMNPILCLAFIIVIKERNAVKVFPFRGYGNTLFRTSTKHIEDIYAISHFVNPNYV